MSFLLNTIKSPTKQNPFNDSVPFFKHLLEITITNNKSSSTKLRLEKQLAPELNIAWDRIQNRHSDFYRLKPISSIQQVVILDNLYQVLLYSFETFLNLNNNINHIHNNNNLQFQWVYNSYILLINSLNIESKVLLFSKYSPRKNRKYKLIKEYKNCIIGNEAINFLCYYRMAINRKDAAILTQTFIDKKYMKNVLNKPYFKDNKSCYSFNDNLIQTSYNDTVDDVPDPDIDDKNGYDPDDISLTQHSDSDSHSSTYDDNIFLSGIKQQTNSNCIQMNKMNNCDKLGDNHNQIISFLLTFCNCYSTENELISYLYNDLKSLIIFPQLSLTMSNTNTNDIDLYCNDIDDGIADDDDNSLWLTYHNRMQYQYSNKYKLNIAPFSPTKHGNINDIQQQKLINVCDTKFNTFAESVIFILIELWDIYNDIATNVYIKLILSLTLVEKAKLFSIAMIKKNKLKKACTFKGYDAVSCLIDCKLASNRPNAVDLGNKFYQKRYLKEIKNEFVFEDSDILYVMMEDELQNSFDELQFYRKQQASNQVKLSLDILTNQFFEEHSHEQSVEICYDYTHNYNTSTSTTTTTNEQDIKYDELNSSPFSKSNVLN